MTVSRKTLGVRSVVAVGFAAVVVTAVVVGVLLMDSPAQERQYRFDERRVADLRELSYAVDDYWTREGVLPPTLDELASGPGTAEVRFDPETGDPYEYRALSENIYELCATFTAQTADEYSTPLNDFWYHGAGRQCYRITAQNMKQVMGR